MVEWEKEETVNELDVWRNHLAQRFVDDVLVLVWDSGNVLGDGDWLEKEMYQFRLSLIEEHLVYKGWDFDEGEIMMRVIESKRLDLAKGLLPAVADIVNRRSGKNMMDQDQALFLVTAFRLQIEDLEIISGE